MFRKNSPSGLVNKIINVYGIPTWISHIAAEKVQGDAVVIVIPGNPGPIGFYETFIESLYESSERTVSIYGISHAGHHFIPCECNSEASEDDTEVAGLCKNFYLNNDTKIYSLHDQVDHKLAFVYNYLPPESKLILIGHSVGAYIILEIMRRLQYTDRVIKGVLLFPTIERITKTSSGKFWTTVAYYMTKPVLWIIWLFNALPFKVQLSFVKCLVCFRRFCKDENLPGAILSFINHHGISNMFQIANDMVHIKDLDQETVIKDNEDKLVFYYGSEDPWVPVSFSDQMKERFQSLDVRLCAESYKHAFVLNSAKDVGKMTWSLIQDVLGIRK